MGVKTAKVKRIIPVSEEEKMNVKKYLRGEAEELGELKDKKLRGQLAVREVLYGKSAQAAARAEKWLMPSEGGYLEVEGIEKTGRIKQDVIAAEVDISSSRKQFDIVLPSLDLISLWNLHIFLVRETVHDVAFLHNQKYFAADHEKNMVLQFRNKHFLLTSINESGEL